MVRQSAAGATFTLTATASDTDGTITKVDLFQGSQLLKSDTTSPYSVSVTLSTAGNYSFTAVATDSDGATTTSAPVTGHGRRHDQPAADGVADEPVVRRDVHGAGQHRHCGDG